MLEGGVIEPLEISEAWVNCVCNVVLDFMLDKDVTDVVSMVEEVNVVEEVLVESDWVEWSSSSEESDARCVSVQGVLPAA